MLTFLNSFILGDSWRSTFTFFCYEIDALIFVNQTKMWQVIVIGFMRVLYVRQIGT